MAGKYWWINERHNPQLGIYYVLMGRVSVKTARSFERGSCYGHNIMLQFKTEAEYIEKIKALELQGRRVHSY